MAAPQNKELSGIIGAIFKFIGVLVGTVVITGKRIIDLGTSPGEGTSDNPKKKSVRKTKAKVPKTKKKKEVKRKSTGPSGKGGASVKKSTRSPAKKKKKTSTPKKKTTPRKTKKTAKSEASSHSHDDLTSKASTGTNKPSEKQESSSLPSIAEIKMAAMDDDGANDRPREDTEISGTTEIQKLPIPVVEYDNRADNAVVPITSVL